MVCSMCAKRLLLFAILVSEDLLRNGYHSQAVPIHLTGIGGPGAPHHFEFVRRCDSGTLKAQFVYV